MKIKVSLTLDEQQANWLIAALETITDGWLDFKSPKYRFFKRFQRNVERRLTPRAADGCKAGQHLVLSGSNKCMACGERVNRRR